MNRLAKSIDEKGALLKKLRDASVVLKLEKQFKEAGIPYNEQLAYAARMQEQVIAMGQLLEAEGYHPHTVDDVLMARMGMPEFLRAAFPAPKDGPKIGVAGLFSANDLLNEYYVATRRIIAADRGVDLGERAARA